ncbi:hypothetical protein E2C01_048967 [Portunus trituberculatus]|uniref:Uncharacterized protein n=1 Tax=Portunus trituberculatus TaxID=210409 RepID=A0A5B7GBX9_PORTR|nr:hypothetical protein [Portunus trituberculatus]
MKKACAASPFTRERLRRRLQEPVLSVGGERRLHQPGKIFTQGKHSFVYTSRGGSAGVLGDRDDWGALQEERRRYTREALGVRSNFQS